MKMKTNILCGKILDWFVAKCEGLDVGFVSGRPCYWRNTYDGMDDFLIPEYASEWKAGGPVFEKLMAMGMQIVRVDPSYNMTSKYRASMDKWETTIYAIELLECAMLCYVAHELGHEVDVPEEFVIGALK